MKTNNNLINLSIGDRLIDSMNQTWILKSFNKVTASLNSQKGGIKMIPIDDLYYQINTNYLTRIDSFSSLVDANLIDNKVCKCYSLDLFRYGCKCMVKI